MVKGFAEFIYLMFTMILLILVIWAFTASTYSAVKYVDLTVEKDVYARINALEGAKSYLETSLDYSVYQSAYDNGAMGGWYDKSGVETKSNSLFSLCGMDSTACKSYTKEKLSEGVKSGDKNYKVGLLQCMLSQLKSSGNKPYYTNPIDCEFGAGSEDALKEFQNNNGLTESGVIDAGALAKLKEIFVTKWGDCGEFFDGCASKVSTLVFWRKKGIDIVPSKEDLKVQMAKSIKNNLDKYLTGDLYFLDKPVGLPIYLEENIKVTESGNKFSVDIKDDEFLTLVEETYPKEGQYEKIVLGYSANIEKSYALRYFYLYEKGAEIFNGISSKNCKDMDKGDILKDNTNGIEIRAQVIEIDKATPCTALVKVDITDNSAKLPVYDGSKVSFEPIGLTYLMRIP
jgi:peptidoglycan hydrolase-like protein with peptidoglycan-binding domain